MVDVEIVGADEIVPRLKRASTGTCVGSFSSVQYFVTPFDFSLLEKVGSVIKVICSY